MKNDLFYHQLCMDKYKACYKRKNAKKKDNFSMDRSDLSSRDERESSLEDMNISQSFICQLNLSCSTYNNDEEVEYFDQSSKNISNNESSFGEKVNTTEDFHSSTKKALMILQVLAKTIIHAIDQI